MIAVIGLNHRTAEIGMREILSLSENESRKLILQLQDNYKETEVVVLSTCNRFELVLSAEFHCTSSFSKDMIVFLKKVKSIKADIETHFYSYYGKQALEHIFKVAAGLDSMVLGENQILGQIKSAYKSAVSLNSTGMVLNKVFHKAFEIGKKVRAKTDLNKGASSIAYAVVQAIKNKFPDFQKESILLVGAGEIARLVARSLTDRGVFELKISNRTLDKASILAHSFGAKIYPFEKLSQGIVEHNIIISATSAKSPIIHLPPAFEAKSLKLFVDLAVPRNISYDRIVESIQIINIDDLKEILNQNMETRKAAIEKSKNIVGQGILEFEQWLERLKFAPIIDALQHKIKKLSMNQLECFKKNLSDKETRIVSDFSNLMNKKYLGLIMKNLKALTQDGKHLEYMEFIDRLFDLTSES